MCGFTFTVFLSAFQLFPTAPFRILSLGGSTFASGLAEQPVYLKVAPDGSLYYISRGASIETGTLHCIQYAPALAPIIIEQPQDATAWPPTTA